jgi:hypothetical protein
MHEAGRYQLGFMCLSAPLLWSMNSAFQTQYCNTAPPTVLVQSKQTETGLLMRKHHLAVPEWTNAPTNFNRQYSLQPRGNDVNMNGNMAVAIPM